MSDSAAIKWQIWQNSREIQKAFAAQAPISHLVELTDGRIIKRDVFPLRRDGKIFGRLVHLNDVTFAEEKKIACLELLIINILFLAIKTHRQLSRSNLFPEQQVLLNCPSTSWGILQLGHTANERILKEIQNHINLNCQSNRSN